MQQESLLHGVNALPLAVIARSLSLLMASQYVLWVLVV